MDISDGLAKDLGRMCTASGTGAWIDAGRIPFSTSVRSALARDPALLASLLSHGDDYVPLVTVAPEKAGAFATAVSPSAPLRPVGEIVDGDAVVIRDFDGRPISFARTGWDHF
jgi:thiamine-monophosphate kinase